MPRRAARLTHAKKKTYKKRKLAGGDPAAPTDEEWKGMVEFGSFIVRDEEGDEHAFKRGDTAMVLPHGVKVGEAIEPYDYWVVKIREVRLRSAEDVWTRVQWYWSGDEVQSAVKSFDGKACGRYERVFSDHFDYVSTSAFDAVVPMKKLVDSDVEQPYIPRDVFFTRYTFEYRARVIQPKPGATTCFCLSPYAPSDPHPSSLMHFCPRPSCRRWFHTRCLVRAGKTDPDTGAASRGRRLLLASPDVDGVRGLRELAGKEVGMGSGRGKGKRTGKGRGGGVEPPRKKVRVSSASGVGGASAAAVGRGTGRGRGRPRGRPRGRGRGGRAAVVVNVGRRTSTRGRKSLDEADADGIAVDGGGDEGVDADAENDEGSEEEEDSDAESDDMQLAALPGDLLHIAEQPIVRGAAFRAGGVSGNVAAVVRARRMVYEVLGGADVPGEWEEVLGVGVKEAVVEVEVEGVSEGEEEGEGEDGEGAGKGKTDRKGKGRAKGRTKERGRPKERESLVALLCPDCGGAI